MSAFESISRKLHRLIKCAYAHISAFASQVQHPSHLYVGQSAAASLPQPSLTINVSQFVLLIYLDESKAFA